MSGETLNLDLHTDPKKTDLVTSTSYLQKKCPYNNNNGLQVHIILFIKKLIGFFSTYLSPVVSQKESVSNDGSPLFSRTHSDIKKESAQTLLMGQNQKAKCDLSRFGNGKERFTCGLVQSSFCKTVCFLFLSPLSM